MSEVINVSSQAIGFSVRGLDEAMRLAKAMASANMVPSCLQNSPGDCLMVIEQSMRWGMSPFAVAQATSVVRGRLCFEGKLVSAAIQSSGVLNGRLSYDFEGEGDMLTVICSGTIKGETTPRTVKVPLASARTSNEWWRKTPEQMLTYHSARVWSRRHAPEVMLGVYSPDEFDTHQSQNSLQEKTLSYSQDLTPQKPKQIPEPPRLEIEEVGDIVIDAIMKKETLTDLESFTRRDKYTRFMTAAREKSPTIVDRVTAALNKKLDQLQCAAHERPAEEQWDEEGMPA